MIAASRRSFITGLVALVAAPAIVRAGSLMPVNSGLVPSNTLLTIDQITQEAVRLFEQSNEFIKDLPPLAPLDVLYGKVPFVDGERWTSEECRALMERQATINETFAADGAKIGDVLRIRLPNDYIVSDGVVPALRELQSYRYVKARRTLEPVPQIPDSLALAAAAVAVAPVVLAKPVTRRFWGK